MKNSTQVKERLRMISISGIILLIAIISCQKDQKDEFKYDRLKKYERVMLKQEPTALNLFNYVRNLEPKFKGSDSLQLPEEVVKTLSNSRKTSYSFNIKVPFDSLFFRNLVVTKTTEGWVGYYLDYYPDYLWMYLNDTLPQIDKFTGKTKKYDLFFNLLYTSYFKDGKMYKYRINQQSKSQAFCIKVVDAYFWIDGIGEVDNCDPYTSSSTGWTYSDCNLIFIGFEIPCTETQGGGSYSSPTWPDGSTDTGTSIPSSGTNGGSSDGTNDYTYGGGGGGTTIGVSNPSIPIIDASSILSNPKTECIYTKLVQTNLMSRYLKNFEGQFPVSHLKYVLDQSLPNNVLGRTYPMDKNYWITIKLNENLVQSLPVLIWSGTILHETIHAEMYRLLVSVGYQVYPDDFPGLFDYYTRYKTGSSAQHQLIADFYIDIISRALQEFDGNKNPYQLYVDIAWIGLQNTDAWNNLTQSERTRILNSINNFQLNGTKVCTNAPPTAIE